MVRTHKVEFDSLDWTFLAATEFRVSCASIFILPLPWSQQQRGYNGVHRSPLTQQDPRNNRQRDVAWEDKIGKNVAMWCDNLSEWARNNDRCTVRIAVENQNFGRWSLEQYGSHTHARHVRGRYFHSRSPSCREVVQ